MQGALAAVVLVVVHLGVKPAVVLERFWGCTAARSACRRARLVENRRYRDRIAQRGGRLGFEILTGQRCIDFCSAIALKPGFSRENLGMFASAHDTNEPAAREFTLQARSSTAKSGVKGSSPCLAADF